VPFELSINFCCGYPNSPYSFLIGNNSQREDLLGFWIGILDIDGDCRAIIISSSTVTEAPADTPESLDLPICPNFCGMCGKGGGSKGFVAQTGFRVGFSFPMTDLCYGLVRLRR